MTPFTAGYAEDRRRALLNGAFSFDGFAPGQYAIFAGLLAARNRAYLEFQRNATITSGASAVFTRTVSSENVPSNFSRAKITPAKSERCSHSTSRAATSRS